MKIKYPLDKFVRTFDYPDTGVRDRLRAMIRSRLTQDTDVYGLSYNVLAPQTGQLTDLDGQDPQWRDFFDFMHDSLRSWVFGCLGGWTTFQYHYQALWAVEYQKGSWARPHRHGAGCVSFVFYVDGSAEHSPLHFDELDLDIPAIPGRLIMFPGWMTHSVKEFQGESRRLLAGNIICI